MYQIHFKGKMTPFELDDHEAERLKSALTDPNRTGEFIEVRGRLITVASIAGMEPVADYRSARLTELPPPPLTLEEKRQRDEIVARMRASLEDKHIIKPKV